MRELTMSLSTAKGPWVAVQVRSKQERTVEAHLDYRGYECFLPLSRETPARDHHIAVTPLFPGYVFCRFEMTASAPIITTPGVIRILSFNGAAAHIEDGEIDAIRRAVESGQGIAPIDVFPPGTTVFNADGPLQGLRGCVLEKNDKQFLVVSITLLRGRSRSNWNLNGSALRRRASLRQCGRRYRNWPVR
jgi:transcription antitermination factor NusG